jgi:2-polyprenyl-6-methoxyphenol hydroxylase-like FAD-dependent oxidoreductase
MSRIVQIGGGIVGLATSLLLARDGHDVTVIERDPAPPPSPDQAWTDWERRGVNQFRLLHFFAARFRNIVEPNIPEVIAAFEGAGALRLNPLREAPVEVTGGFRDSDAKYDTITARRPVAEAAIASVVAKNDQVVVQRGTAVAGLLTNGGSGRVPHVVGVRTDAGEELRADLVIDCSGRRSTLPTMLTDIGAGPPREEKADCGFVYYGRHFTSADGSVPFAFGPLLMDYGTISTLTLPADNGTWGLGIIVSANDKAMRRLQDVDTWERVIKAFPLVAHWLDGAPLDEKILVMAKIEDRKRDFAIDGQPLATGVVALADSWACSNPSLGRGMSIGMIHAVALRDLLRDAPDDALELARAFNDATEATAEPYVRGTLDYDESRITEVNAELDGAPFTPSADFERTKQLFNASGKDPDLLRAVLDLAMVMASPEDVLGRPEVVEGAGELGANWRNEPLPGPNREELLTIVS